MDCVMEAELREGGQLDEGDRKNNLSEIRAKSGKEITIIVERMGSSSFSLQRVWSSLLDNGYRDRAENGLDTMFLVPAISIESQASSCGSLIRFIPCKLQFTNKHVIPQCCHHVTWWEWLTSVRKGRLGKHDLSLMQFVTEFSLFR